MMDGEGIQNKIVSKRKDGERLNRTDTKMLIQAVLNKWITAQDEYADEIRQTLLEVMKDKESRQRVDAAKAFSAMAGEAARVFEVADKIERLDGGEATENIRIVQYVVDKGLQSAD
jgi:CRISPR/Cas system-associated protein Cas5 (RAMP superfamily)